MPLYLQLSKKAWQKALVMSNQMDFTEDVQYTSACVRYSVGRYHGRGAGR
jgi:hypothetical protein